MDRNRRTGPPRAIALARGMALGRAMARAWAFGVVAALAVTPLAAQEDVGGTDPIAELASAHDSDLLAARERGAAPGRSRERGQREPERWIGDERVLSVRAHDVPRSLERLRASPYAGWEQTPWGALLAGRLRHDRAGVTTEFKAVAGSIRSLAVGVGVAEGQPDIRWAVDTGDAGPLSGLCDRLDAGDDRVTRDGGLFAFHARGVVPRAGVAAPARFPDACVELSLDPIALLAGLGLAAPGSDGATPRTSARPVTIGLTLDALGLRERWDVPVAEPEHWRLVRLPRVDPRLLAALPAEALMGCAFVADGDASISALACTGIAEQPAALIAADLALARLGLPTTVDLLGGLRGPCVAWIEEGSPAPSVTLVAGMDEGLARRLLPILALNAGMSRLEDGALVGFLGASACEADYRDGRLVITTHPGGIDGCLGRAPGFGDHPEVAQALAELPRSAVLIGASRSGPAASALARIALRPLAHLGLPQLSTLPRDLEARGRHGFLAVTQVEHGLRVDAAGLLGGPCAAYATIGGLAYASWVAILRRGPTPEREAEGRVESGGTGAGKRL